MSSIITSTPLEQLMATGQGAVDPSAYPDEVFELFSIPAYDSRTPDVLSGSQIGSAKKTVQPGDVLLSRIVPHIRRAWVVPKSNGKRQIASGEWIIFRGSHFHPSYLRHFLMSDVFHVHFMNTVAGVGGSLLRARPAFVGKIEIPLPPLPEQKRIADILDKADAIRRKRQEAIRTTGKLREAAFRDLRSKKEGRASDWLEKPMSDIGHVQGGIALSARRNSLPLTVPYLRVANVYRDRLELAEVKEVGVTEAELEKTSLEQGDVLLVEGHGNRQEIGRSSVWDDSVSPCVHQNHLIRVRPHREVCEPVYLSAYINSAEGRKQLFRCGKTTSGLNTISLTNVRNTNILLPPIDMQRQFAAFVRRLEDHVATVTTIHDESEDLFNGLLQRAFKGEL